MELSKPTSHNLQPADANLIQAQVERHLAWDLGGYQPDRTWQQWANDACMLALVRTMVAFHPNIRLFGSNQYVMKFRLDAMAANMSQANALGVSSLEEAELSEQGVDSFRLGGKIDMEITKDGITTNTKAILRRDDAGRKIHKKISAKAMQASPSIGKLEAATSQIPDPEITECDARESQIQKGDMDTAIKQDDYNRPRNDVEKIFMEGDNSKVNNKPWYTALYEAVTAPFRELKRPYLLICSVVCFAASWYFFPSPVSVISTWFGWSKTVQKVDLTVRCFQASRGPSGFFAAAGFAGLFFV